MKWIKNNVQYLFMAIVLVATAYTFYCLYKGIEAMW